MPQGARVDSVDTLTLFKSAIFKFQEAAQIALSDAEGEMQRVLLWVENEQQSYWQNQIRKCEQAVVRAKEAVRMKKVFKDASGRQQSAVDEEKALQLETKKLAVAQTKLAAVKRWTRQLQKEIELYKGGVQRFATTIQAEIPRAAAHLESLAAKLDAYLSVQPAEGAQASVTTGPSMARGRVSAGADARGETLGIPLVPPEQRAEVGSLDVEPRPPGENVQVFVSAGGEPAFPITLRRDEYGWYVGAAQPVEDKAVLASDILREREDLSELLSLPPGFSVIMDSAGIVEVQDSQRHTVWTRGTT
jgi:hypothetical protein